MYTTLFKSKQPYLTHRFSDKGWKETVGNRICHSILWKLTETWIS